MLKPLAPSLKVYKALPADGIHPPHSLMFFASLNLEVLFAQRQANLTGALDAVAPACKTSLPPSQQWQCLLTNTTLKHISTPLFAVQQLASVWDTKCGALDGLVTGWGAAGANVPTLNQIVCDPPGNAWVVNGPEWQCFNSPQVSGVGKPADFSKCTAAQLATIAGYQQQYIDQYLRSGMATKPGNGGFFHSCE